MGKLCSVEGCDRIAEARDLCHAHLLRLIRLGDVQADVALRLRRRPTGRSTLPPAFAPDVPPEEFTPDLLMADQGAPDRLPKACGDLPQCSAGDCDRKPTSRSLCATHYKRLQRQGSTAADQPVQTHRVSPDGAPVPRLSRRLPDEHILDERLRCSVGECGRGIYAKGICRAHYRRQMGQGDMKAATPIRLVSKNGKVKNGYRIVPVPLEDRWLTHGATPAAEHRVVMAKSLDRPLRDDESVHHKNGDRLDNRLANLELWSRWQPSGQRVADKVTHALELIKMYSPRSLS